MNPTSVTLPGALPTAGPPAAPQRSFVQHVMGMPISLLVRGPLARQPAVQQAADRVFAELRRVDELFSTYRDDSEVSRLDRGELDPGGCDPAVRNVLQLCEQARERTGGWFDAYRPSPHRSGRSLDPSGLVKGWAAQRAARHLAALPGHDWVLNAGGDVAVGAGEDRPWRVGVEDPLDRARLLAVVPMTGGGLATSGGAARGDHVVDPRTGAPARTWASVSVTGPSLLWADVYATAALVAGELAPAWLESLDGYEALLVRPDRGQYATARWPGTSAGR